jgi:hypothetical protein
MKRIFLIASVLGFAGAVSAQQNDLFDVQEHLKKKGFTLLWKTPWGSDPLTLSNIETFGFPFFICGEGVVIKKLPVDNMPCIVPDMEFFKVMPNVATDISLAKNYFPNKTPGIIPNPAPLPGIK